MVTKKLIQVALVLAMVVASFASHAAEQYSPAQLRQMVDSGNPPKQGAPSTTTQNLAFEVCVSKVTAIIDAIQEQYPAKILVKTNIFYMAKVWTNNGAMTLSCSKPDNKLIVTNAKYL